MADQLIGWKEISQYLEVSEKTASRYKKEKGLPVKKNPAGHPVITKSKIDNWQSKEESA